eukprot:3496972-Karenia_brevis.AAC.1
MAGRVQWELLLRCFEVGDSAYYLCDPPLLHPLLIIDLLTLPDSSSVFGSPVFSTALFHALDHCTLLSRLSMDIFSSVPKAALISTLKSRLLA